MTYRVESLLRRLQRLPLKPEELGITQELALFQLELERGEVDEHLLEILEDRLQSIEEQLRSTPYLVPTSVVSDGQILLGNTAGGEEVRTSIGIGGSSWDHALLAGSVGQGKSVLSASLAIQAAETCDVVMIDSVNTFWKIEELRKRATLIDIRDLRQNQFDEIPGLYSCEQDEVVLKGLAQAYQMQLAEREMFEAAKELRALGSVDPISLRDYLAVKKYYGVSNRPRFRDTAVLHLSYLIDGTWPLFDCKKGMDLFEILSQGLVVLRLHSILGEHQAYIVRLLFDYLQLISRSSKRLERPLLLILDEAQLLLKSEANLAEKMLSLRHSRVHLCCCVQHPSLVQAEVLGNCQLHVCFSLLDERDRFNISKSLGLTQGQAASLMTLGRGQAVCFLSRSAWRRPFLLNSPVMEIAESAWKYERPTFLAELEWTPRVADRVSHRTDSKSQNADGVQARGKVPSSGLSEDEERLLRDVCTQAHEFSKLGDRFERVGIRSASVQRSVLRSLQSKGMIKTWDLAIGRGHPISLLEATDRSFEILKLSKWKSTRGVLPTRAATFVLKKKFEALTWTCVLEGLIEGKQVDLLLRHEGKLFTLEVAHSPDHEVFNARHCLASSEVVSHVVVCTGNKTQEAVEKRFSACSDLSSSKRIEILMLSKALGSWIPGLV